MPLLSCFMSVDGTLTIQCPTCHTRVKAGIYILIGNSTSCDIYFSPDTKMIMKIYVNRGNSQLIISSSGYWGRGWYILNSQIFYFPEPSEGIWSAPSPCMGSQYCIYKPRSSFHCFLIISVITEHTERNHICFVSKHCVVLLSVSSVFSKICSQFIE
jgi:hypothetical protein